MSTLMDELVTKVMERVRALYEREHPGKGEKLEFNLELLELDIMQHLVINELMRDIHEEMDE